jgi:membrane protease YdiL (CAAX protease family)
MKRFSRLHPRQFIKLLSEIHSASFNESQQQSKQQWDYRPAIVLMTAAICLLLLNYVKFFTVFTFTVNTLLTWFSDDAKTLFHHLRQHLFFPLMGEAWWSFWHILAFILIPVFVIKVILKDRLSDYGLGLGRLRERIKWYLLLVTPILCFVFMVSFRDDFSTHYPFYRQANRSWFDLLTWEILYLVQFICVEFFFRGFIIQACRPSFGVNAIFVMIVPYLMLHFSKPWLEASGAIFFGLFLGVLALHTRSIWGGVMVHISIALSMDIAALLQTKGLPQQWWP